MAKLSLVVLLLVVVSVSLVAGKPKRKFPPNKQTSLSDKEIDNHPRFKPNAHHRGVTLIPPSFDARVQWPKCDSIKTIRDQGQCGTCWAVSSASVLSDRICIASGQTNNIFISANQAASCSVPGQSSADNCNAGGDASTVYKHASMYGLPTGGGFSSNVGCVPYQVSPDKAEPLSCSSKCTNAKYTKPLAQDLSLIDGYWINYQKQDAVMTQAQIDAVVNQMQTDIITNGPLTASIMVYEDFQEWEPKNGVYSGPKAGSPKKGGHAIRIIGWNKSATGVRYWLIANSWSSDVGDKGVFWLEMGKNVVGIESTVSAPTVKMINPCSGQSFCDTPIDQAILSNIKDTKSPAFLFQNNCTQQISISATGKLTAVGPAVPISKAFLGAPAGPITSYIIQNDKLWLLNSAGQAGADCYQPAGASKFTCGRGTGSGGSSAQAKFYTGSTLNSWSYYPDHINWLFNTQGKGTNVGNMLTTPTFSAITSLLNVDGQKMVVFGKDAAGKAISGVMSYPSASQASFAWVIQPGPVKNVLTCSSP